MSFLMAKSRIEVERFDGKGDFSLWKKRILAHLSVLGLKDVLEEFTSPSESLMRKDEDEDVFRERLLKEEAERLERSEKEMNLIILNVGDHVLRRSNCVCQLLLHGIHWRGYIFRGLCRIEFTSSTNSISSRWSILGVWMRISMTS